jgi:glyoxylase-like metal-dependent hydrolase (beta-lactamase superfamily II)
MAHGCSWLVDAIATVYPAINPSSLWRERECLQLDRSAVHEPNRNCAVRISPQNVGLAVRQSFWDSFKHRCANVKAPQGGLMTRTHVLGTLLALGSLSMTVAAVQQPPAGQQTPRVVEVDKLKDNLYVAKGGGGNSSIFITAAGVVVVDTKNPGWGQPLLDAIKKVTDKPVTMIVNTHTHGDHVSGNVEFPAEVDIVTHENTAANMKLMRPNSSAAPTATPPANIFTQNNGRGLPKRTFRDRMTIGQGNDRIELYYFGRAHTNGDAMVFFPVHRVLHIADVFPGKELPIMDSNNGGTGVGYAETLTKTLRFAEKNADVIVNGHNSTTTTSADLKDYVQFIRNWVKDVQDAKKSGKTVDDVASSWKPPSGYNAQPARVRSDAQLIFDETK